MPKWLRSLAIVLTVLGAVTLVSLLPRPSTKPKTPPWPKDIQRFSLLSSDLSLALENNDGDWRIKTPIDVPANEGTVGGFLASLRSLELEEVLSRRPESFSLYALDDASGVRLKVWAADAQKPQEWVIGKDSPSGGHVYVRIGNAPEVYLAKGLSRSLAGADLKTWRDTRILPLPADAPIQSIRVYQDRENLIFEKSSDTWTVNGKTVQPEKVDPLLTNLRYLTADDFVDPPESIPEAAELATAPTHITVTLRSGESHDLRIGTPQKGNGSRALIRRDEDPHLMGIDLRHMELLKVTEKELLSKSTPKI